MLRSQMHNGATVADWLGTAMTAGQLAVERIEFVRSGKADLPALELEQAVERLEQALDEVRQVQTHLAHLNAYGPR